MRSPSAAPLGGPGSSYHRMLYPPYHTAAKGRTRPGAVNSARPTMFRTRPLDPRFGKIQLQIYLPNARVVYNDFRVSKLMEGVAHCRIELNWIELNWSPTHEGRLVDLWASTQHFWLIIYMRAQDSQVSIQTRIQTSDFNSNSAHDNK
jgi:hypothetical protein